MTRLRGRCPRGQRLRAKAPFGHWLTQTFIAGLRCEGLTAPFVVNEPMNRAIFDVYVETQLAPTLRPGDVVILDNLPAHISPKAEQAIKRARGLDALPARLQSRLEPHRNGLRQAQSTPPRQGSQDHR
jgi:DDE superfamily endonuclease